MRYYLLPLSLLVTACSGGDGPGSETGTESETTPTTPIEPTEPEGMCGDITYWDVTLTGAVDQANGEPAVGALVHVEERAWTMNQIEQYGPTVTTDSVGNFEVLLPDVRSVEDCWGFMDYNVVATLGGLSGEAELNSVLFSAIDSGTFLADISAIPVELEAP
jgi:hypothetical protein